jgi:hypothetical protein
MASNWNSGNSMVWDFLYQAVVVGLGIAAAAAIYIDISGL